MFADGPTIGASASRIKARVTSLSGIRAATVSKPPVTVVDTVPGMTGKIIVNGPGQKASINFSAHALTTAKRSTCALSATWTINGLSDGRPFAAYTLLTAFSLKASAPKPYTVSVGNATSDPRLIARTAAGNSSADQIFVSAILFMPPATL